VDGRCIVLVGGSKGAELALSLAARYSDIGGVVAIVPSHTVFPGITDAMTTSSFTWKGEPLPFVPVPWSTAWPLLSGDLLRVSEIMLEDAVAVERAAIPVEDINGPILLVSATRDEFWPSRAMADAMMQRLDARQFPFAHEHLAIEGGHAEPLKHFDRIEAFLDAQFRRGDVPGCAGRS
jgi:pimeloyl-ACP methyl ester carboxylesterase